MPLPQSVPVLDSSAPLVLVVVSVVLVVVSGAVVLVVSSPVVDGSLPPHAATSTVTIQNELERVLMNRASTGAAYRNAGAT